MEDTNVAVRVVNGNRVWTALGTVADGVPHSCAFINPGSSTDDLIAFQDGIQLAVLSTSTRTLNTSAANPWFGRRPSSSGFLLNGEIQWAMIYDRAIASSQAIRQTSDLIYNPLTMRKRARGFVPVVAGGTILPQMMQHGLYAGTPG